MSDEAITHVLWARSERYETPFVVAAWSDGYRKAYTDAFWAEVGERKSYIECFGDESDGPWLFCLTVERMAHPVDAEWTLDPDVVCDFAGHDYEDAGGGLEICTECQAEQWANPCPWCGGSTPKRGEACSSECLAAVESAADRRPA